MMHFFPVASKETLLQQAGEQWNQCSHQDWLEAFAQHPQIGDITSLQHKFTATAHWTAGEQSGTADAGMEVLKQLAAANLLYEKKFGFIFIVCATGKSATEMLEILRKRLPNNQQEEIMHAAAEQEKITAIRLQKLLQ